MKFLISLFLFITKMSFGQPLSIQWERSFGGSNDEVGTSIKQTFDGGYLIAGYTASDDGDISGNHTMNHYDYWVIKTDSSGTLAWQKCYGGSSDEVAFSLELTNDSGFILAGYAGFNDGDVTGVHTPYSTDYWIVKCSSLGDIEWQKCLGGSNDDDAHHIIRSKVGGYVVIGYAISTDYDVTNSHTNSTCLGCSDAWVVRLDSIGNELWAKCYGGSWTEDGNSIIETADSGFIIMGMTLSNDGDVLGLHGTPGSNSDFLIVKIDSVGNVQWQKCYGGLFEEVPYSFVPTLDNGYVIIGSTCSNDFDVNGNHNIQPPVTDSWVVKIDSIGNLQWQKCLGGSDFDVGTSIIQMHDSTFLALYNSTSSDGDVTCNHSSSSDIILAKLDVNGTIEWQECFGGTFSEQGYSIQETVDSGIVISGLSQSSDGDVSVNHGGYDVWVVKLSSIDNFIRGPNLLPDVSFSLRRIDDHIILTFSSGNMEKIQLQLQDITGRLIFTKSLNITSGLNKHEVYVGKLNCGVYIVSMMTQEMFVSTKLVVE
ncbi:MAG: hypothetical protein ABI763_17655 [Bacteroidota bacterium]